MILRISFRLSDGSVLQMKPMTPARTAPQRWRPHSLSRSDYPDAGMIPDHFPIHRLDTRVLGRIQSNRITSGRRVPRNRNVWPRLSVSPMT